MEKMAEIKTENVSNTDALYGLRFVMISLLILHHLYYPLNTGVLSVSFFLILSGFVIGYSNKKRNEEYDSWRSIFKFVKKRIEKLYPLYLVVTVSSIIPLVYLWKYSISLLDIIPHLLLIKTWIPINVEKTFWFGGASWYVSTLFFCYIATPFLYMLLKKISAGFERKRVLLACVGMLYITEVLVAFPIKGIEAYSITWWFLYVSPFRIFDYAIGMVAGILFGSENSQEYNISKMGSYAIGTTAELIAVGIVWYAYTYCNTIQSSLAIGVIWTIPCLILILVFAGGRGLLSAFLASKVMVYLGNLNYPMYIIHQMLFEYMQLLMGVGVYYTTDVGYDKNWRTIFLFVLIICVSDGLNRLVVTRSWRRREVIQ